jgi:hypothetical protein
LHIEGGNPLFADWEFYGNLANRSEYIIGRNGWVTTPIDVRRAQKRAEPSSSRDGALDAAVVVAILGIGWLKHG